VRQFYGSIPIPENQWNREPPELGRARGTAIRFEGVCIPINALLDNNVFDALLGAPPEQLDTLVAEIAAGRIVCYVSPEVIQETFGLVANARLHPKLAPRTALLCKLAEADFMSHLGSTRVIGGLCDWNARC
jgi:hypothetical protein